MTATLCSKQDFFCHMDKVNNHLKALSSLLPGPFHLHPCCHITKLRSEPEWLIDTLVIPSSVVTSSGLAFSFISSSSVYSFLDKIAKRRKQVVHSGTSLA